MIYPSGNSLLIIYLLNTNGGYLQTSLVRDSDGWEQCILPKLSAVSNYEGITFFCPKNWHIRVTSENYKQYVVMALI